MAFPFASLFDGLGPCHLAAASGEIVYANRALKTLLAQHGEALPERLPQHVITRALRQPDGVRTSVALRRGNAERQFKASHRALGDDASGSRQILTTFEETTREAQALAAIRRTKDRSDDLMRVVSDWVWESDRDWRIGFLATRDGSLLGRPTEAMTGSSLFDLGRFVPNPERPNVRLPQPRQRAAFHDALFSARHADGSERYFLVSAVPIFGEQDGLFEGFRGSAADVTDRLAAEADARAYRGQLEATLAELKARNQELSTALDAANAAATAKSEFLAMMSHELRTPLNAVIGFSEVMEMEAFGPIGHDNYKGYVGDILQSGRFLLSMINEILDLVKLESGHMELFKEVLDVQEAVRGCQRLVAEQARRKSIEISIEIPRGVRVLADPKRLRQLVLNILSNAVKFTPEGGRVEITAEAGPMVSIHCRDTGIGIPEDKLDLVFEPFRQVDSSLARKHEGTGLGLPIARSIAEHHGGQLTLVSAPDQGTTVTVRLPAAD